MKLAFFPLPCLAVLGCLAATVRAQEPPAPAGEEESVERSQGGETREEGGGDQERKGEEQHADPPQGQSGANGDVVPPAPAPAPGPAEIPANPAGEEPNVATRPAVTWPLDPEAIGAHLREIAGRYPALASLHTIGRSSRGREIQALFLTDGNSGPARSKPMLLVVDFQGAAQCGSEAAVELAWRTCERFAADERVRGLLGKTALVIAPALDPDGRASPPEAAPEVFFDRNFPLGWQPQTLRAGAGKISLSQPETLAVVRFLSELEHVAIVLGIAVPQLSSGLYAGAELPPEDREVFLKLCTALGESGGPPAVPWFELGSPGGGFFDYCYQARGIYPLALAPPAEAEIPGALTAWLAASAERALDCLALLPRVEVLQEGLQRLAGDLWQLDVRIGNAGIVPTLSVLARRRERGDDISFSLQGAKLVATARRAPGGASYLDASFPAEQRSSALSCGTLAGGEERWLRLILEAASGTRIELLAGATWAGAAHLEVALP